jgi:superfamily II DNA or RNA helicase
MIHGVKLADVRTPLQPHQQRVIDKLKASGGLLVAHGVGSGKTLSSIAAADALGLPIEAVVPAPLVANYEKELAKHLDKMPDDARIRSYEKAVRDKDINLAALAIMDEAHRARNAGTLISKDVAGQVAKAKARLLLTGTPVYNQPYDLAALLNTAAGRKVLPDDPALFKKTFVGEETIEAPLLERIKGRVLGHPVDTVTRQKLINRQFLVNAAKGFVDVHKGGGEGFPDRVDETHHVEMSPGQHKMYEFHSNQMPWYLRAKIRAGLPLDKQESRELNAFQGALRQASNTPRPYVADMSHEEEAEHTPKIQMMAKHLKEMHGKDPNFRGVVYSNYLNAGLEPMSRALQKHGIPHNVFTGEVSKKQRDQMVKDYNSGKVPVLLVSGAGSEGLDLKGTKAIQLMEPHWNESRINQVIGRGIRYQSHAHLPDEERKVRVMRYMSTLPKTLAQKSGLNYITGQKPPQSVEQYMKSMSDDKERFSNQIASALQEASDLGPLRKIGSDDLPHGKDLMREIAYRMGNSEVTPGAKSTLDVTHPTGVILKNKYDAGFVRDQIKEKFNGNINEFVDQLNHDMLSSGYAAIGAATKKNQERLAGRQLQYGAYGGLAGLIGSQLASPAVIARLVSKGHRGLAGVTSWAAPTVGVLGGTTLGRHVGKWTHKDIDIKDMEAKQVHPLLVPPKVVKQRTTLSVKE